MLSIRRGKISRPAASKPTPKRRGAVPGVEVFDTFSSRKECRERGVHGVLTAGIWGDSTYGAYSVVLSGGYEDDEDNGEYFTYTGEGGRDSRSGQVKDQEWSTTANKSLSMSHTHQNPVRVIRGSRLKSRFAPEKGYRYDGLYKIVDRARRRGEHGYKTCQYLFKRLPDQPPMTLVEKRADTPPLSLSESCPSKSPSPEIRQDVLLRKTSRKKKDKNVALACVDETSLESTSQSGIDSSNAIWDPESDDDMNLFGLLEYHRRTS